MGVGVGGGFEKPNLRGIIYECSKFKGIDNHKNLFKLRCYNGAGNRGKYVKKQSLFIAKFYHDLLTTMDYVHNVSNTITTFLCYKM
jgi:hypothetical protein